MTNQPRDHAPRAWQADDNAHGNGDQGDTEAQDAGKIVNSVYRKGTDLVATFVAEPGKVYPQQALSEGEHEYP